MKCLRPTLGIFIILAAGIAPAMPASAQPSQSEQLYAAAQASLAAGHYNDARKDYEQLSKLSPTIAEIHATLGAIDYQLKLFPEALEQLNEAHRLKPSLPRIDGLIAMSLSELGRFREALPGLEVVFKDADDPQIKRMSGLQLERTYTGLNQEINAVSVALTLQKLFPKDPEVLYHNERVFGSFAYLTVQKLVEVAPNSIWRHQAQAEALEAAGNHELSINEYRTILSIDPNRLGAHYRIGRALRAQAHDTHQAADITAAMQEFQAELRLNPDNASALYEIGELHRLANESELARDSFLAALKIYPDFPEANLGLGTVLADLQEPAKALTYLRRATASDPDDETSWYRLSQVERSLGHITEQKNALAQFQRLHRVSGAQTSLSTRDVTKQVLDPIVSK